MISTRWAECQEEYYKDKESQRTGKAWAARTIRLLWKFVFGVWQGRNVYLHKTDRILELEGKEELLEAVAKEMDIRLHRLPAADYSYMFRLKKDVLLQKEMEYLKDWLFIIRTARKTHKDPAYINDKFCTDSALRRWIDSVTNN